MLAGRVEFNNSINSLKSLCSFIMTPVAGDEVEKDVEALLGRELPVVLPVRPVAFARTWEDSNITLHGSILPENGMHSRD